MSHRRILSLWFPRLAAERVLRQRQHGLALDIGPQPFAVVGDDHGAQVLTSLNAEAERAGLALGQPLRDATAMCPSLLTRAADPLQQAQFLTHLRRWAGKFSPWVAEEAADGLVIDLTGCAHLFGGEVALLAQVELDCADIGLSVRAAIADTRGAAWALARYAGRKTGPVRGGDAIDQEARATRSRAAKRRGWERGGDAPSLGAVPLPQGMIAPPGRLHEALGPLPIAALRVGADVVAALARLGLRRIEEIAGMPRAALARRFGVDLLRRLDQALGLEPEPIAPARAPLHFATRLTLPEPIGLTADVQAAIDRLLPPLCDRLRAQGRGARVIRLEAYRSDGGLQRAEVGLARPADRPDSIRPLLALKLDGLDAGYGFDCIRLQALMTEPVHAVQHRGQMQAGQAAAARNAGMAAENTALADLLGKLGARLGSDAVTRMQPGASHIPEKAALTLAAAWSDPWDQPWPRAATPRPLLIFRPEPLALPETDPTPPAQFRWRRRDLVTRVAAGPERILPEWWLDDPDWRSGPRDYWRIEVSGGERLWLYHAHGADMSGGWFVQGLFA